MKKYKIELEKGIYQGVDESFYLSLKVIKKVLKDHYNDYRKTINDLGNFPSDDEIETASIDYRDKSDDENTNEETNLIDVNWWDKQDAFQAGAKWMKDYLQNGN